MYVPFQARGPSFVDGLLESLRTGQIASEPRILAVTACAVVFLLLIVRTIYVDDSRSFADIIGAWALLGLFLVPWVGVYLWPGLGVWIPDYPGVPLYPYVYPTAVTAVAAVLATFPKIVHSPR